MNFSRTHFIVAPTEAWSFISGRSSEAFRGRSSVPEEML